VPAFGCVSPAATTSGSVAKRNARKLSFACDGSWQAMTHPVVGCMACQSDRQVYGIEIELV
jgi:hypothetical protein